MLSRARRVYKTLSGSGKGHKQAESPSTESGRVAEYTTLTDVQRALQQAGLESSSLVIAVDFTKSNVWKGETSFGGRSLHHIDASTRNPYEQALHSLCTALASFDDEQHYHCIGFGDVTTKDKSVFTFLPAGAPSGGLQGALQRYRQIAPYVRMAGPTSFAACIREAMRLVVAAECQFHILLIIADGQVTSGRDVGCSAKTVQEQETRQALIDASHLPLSIVCIGVGDGPWDCMQDYNDCGQEQRFNNYHFVDYTAVIEAANIAGLTSQQCDAQLAMHALMRVPEQYKAVRRFGLLSAVPPLHVRNSVGPPPLPPPPTVPMPTLGLAGHPNANSTAQSPFREYAHTGWHTPAAPQTEVANDRAMHIASFASAVSAMSHASSGRLPPGSPLCSGAPSTSLTSHGSDTLSLRCPLTGTFMSDPVMAADGHMYERAAIRQHFSVKGAVSPITRDHLPNTILISCNALRRGSANVQQVGTAPRFPAAPSSDNQRTSANSNAAPRSMQISTISNAAARSVQRSAASQQLYPTRNQGGSPTNQPASQSAGGPRSDVGLAPRHSVSNHSDTSASVAVGINPAPRSIQRARTAESFIGYEDLPSPVSAGTPARLDSNASAGTAPLEAPVAGGRGTARMWELSLLSGTRDTQLGSLSGVSSPTSTHASTAGACQVPPATQLSVNSGTGQSVHTEDFHASIPTNACISVHSPYTQGATARTQYAEFVGVRTNTDDVEVSPFEDPEAYSFEMLVPFGSNVSGGEGKSRQTQRQTDNPAEESGAAMHDNLHTGTRNVSGSVESPEYSNTEQRKPSDGGGLTNSFRFSSVPQSAESVKMLPQERRMMSPGDVLSSPADPLLREARSLSEELDTYSHSGRAHEHGTDQAAAHLGSAGQATMPHKQTLAAAMEESPGSTSSRAHRLGQPTASHYAGWKDQRCLSTSDAGTTTSRCAAHAAEAARDMISNDVIAKARSSAILAPAVPSQQPAVLLARHTERLHVSGASQQSGTQPEPHKGAGAMSDQANLIFTSLHKQTTQRLVATVDSEADPSSPGSDISPFESTPMFADLDAAVDDRSVATVTRDASAGSAQVQSGTAVGLLISEESQILSPFFSAALSVKTSGAVVMKASSQVAASSVCEPDAAAAPVQAIAAERVSDKLLPSASLPLVEAKASKDNAATAQRDDLPLPVCGQDFPEGFTTYVQKSIPSQPSWLENTDPSDSMDLSPFVCADFAPFPD